MREKEKNHFWQYYIKGAYHCDTCPFCWGGEYLPGCDDYEDCGCFVRGDIRDTCRLIPPMRFLLGWGKRKKAQYYETHKYDDAGEWYEKKYEEDQAFIRAFDDYLKQERWGIFVLDKEGKPFIDPNGSPLRITEYYDIYRFQDACRDIFNPYIYETLKDKWIKLIKETWNRFLMIFKPYFCK